jgi:two-component system, chemotaxis family, response regulator Rcp1
MITSANTAPEVLLVDDNPGDTDLTSEILRQSKHRFHVNVVNDGQKALEFLRQKRNFTTAPRPQLILLDLRMPRVDGMNVLREVKKDPALSNIPVVIFTASQAAADVIHCYELGANCYLPKPGNLPDFVHVVKSMADFWFGFASLPQKERPS